MKKYDLDFWAIPALVAMMLGMLITTLIMVSGCSRSSEYLDMCIKACVHRQTVVDRFYFEKDRNTWVCECLEE